MSELDHIAIRVVRNGHPVSAFVSELAHITDAELVGYPLYVSGAIRAAMEASNEWGHDMLRRVWVNASAEPLSNPQ